MDYKQLTEKERTFCELYVNGTAPYAGNPSKCYAEVFKCEGGNALHLARRLLNTPDIQDYIKELENQGAEEAAAMKRYLTRNLMGIIDEMTSAQFRDRRGTLLSTAPLRSVAVNAAKALMDMYPVKEAQTTNLNIGSSNEGGITFNVIVPEQNPEPENGARQ